MQYRYLACSENRPPGHPHILIPFSDTNRVAFQWPPPAPADFSAKPIFQILESECGSFFFIDVDVHNLYTSVICVCIWVCLKIVYPIVPNGFADHYPYEKWL